MTHPHKDDAVGTDTLGKLDAMFCWTVSRDSDFHRVWPETLAVLRAVYALRDSDAPFPELVIALAHARRDLDAMIEQERK